jgi:hypothetical protein
MEKFCLFKRNAKPSLSQLKDIIPEIKSTWKNFVSFKRNAKYSLSQLKDIIPEK